MRFQKQWEEEHQKREWGKYPNENVIKFIARSFYKVGSRYAIKILDAGCGIGANAWFLIREGFNVYGFDGSETAILRLKHRLQEENLYRNRLEQFSVEDALNISYEENFFDAIIDHSMLPYLDDISIVDMLKKYRKMLKLDEGKLFCGGLHEVNGVYGIKSGKKMESSLENGRADMIGEIKEGRLQGGYYHNFFSRDKIYDLFQRAGFQRISIDHFTETYDDESLNYRYFNVVASE